MINFVSGLLHQMHQTKLMKSRALAQVAPESIAMSQHPDGGMYSIKLVSPAHLDDVRFAPDTANDGRPRVMNFSDQGRTPAIAASISPGHRALVYVTHPVQKLLWAIE
jgi:hypothetical protein